MHDGVEAAHGGGERARACPVAAQKFWRSAAAVARHLGGGGATALLGTAGECDADASLCEVRGRSCADAAGAADDEDALLHGSADCCGREEREHRGRVGGTERAVSVKSGGPPAGSPAARDQRDFVSAQKSSSYSDT